MKKIILTFTVLLTIIILNSCKNNIEDQSTTLPHIDIDKSIGQKHNDGLTNFINSNSKKIKSNKISNEEQLDYVVDYINDTYQTNISDIKENVLNNLRDSNINSMPVYQNINIEGYINCAIKNRSTYFKSQILDILGKIENCKTDTAQMQIVICESLEKAYNDNSFSTNEKEYYINMLYVYQSSIRYWYNLVPKYKITEKDYWKIPTADWIGGICGSLGGPAGAIGGLVGGSLSMWIGLL